MAQLLGCAHTPQLPHKPSCNMHSSYLEDVGVASATRKEFLCNAYAEKRNLLQTTVRMAGFRKPYLQDVSWRYSVHAALNRHHDGLEGSWRGSGRHVSPPSQPGGGGVDGTCRPPHSPSGGVVDGTCRRPHSPAGGGVDGTCRRPHSPAGGGVDGTCRPPHSPAGGGVDGRCPPPHSTAGGGVDSTCRPPHSPAGGGVDSTCRPPHSPAGGGVDGTCRPPHSSGGRGSCGSRLAPIINSWWERRPPSGQKSVVCVFRQGAIAALWVRVDCGCHCSRLPATGFLSLLAALSLNFLDQQAGHTQGTALDISCASQ